MPPFCPRSSCPYHRCPTGWRYKRIGFYSRHCLPRHIQRYLCLHCRRSFSTQTFSTTYWLRRPELLEPLFYRLLTCSGFRQLTRELKASASTLVHLAARLGRHCLLFQRLHQPSVKETVALDGFESFEWSQYFPCHFHVLVGCDSHFFYGFTDSPLRRKGRMTPRQRIRREQLELQLGRPDPGSIRHEVAALLRLCGLSSGARRAPHRRSSGLSARLPRATCPHGPPPRHVIARAAHDQEPAVPGQPAGPADPPQQRQPQARDDRVLQAAAGGDRAAGAAPGVAKLHQAVLGAARRWDAGGTAGPVRSGVVCERDPATGGCSPHGSGCRRG